MNFKDGVNKFGSAFQKNKYKYKIRKIMYNLCDDFVRGSRGDSAHTRKSSIKMYIFLNNIGRCIDYIHHCNNHNRNADGVGYVGEHDEYTVKFWQQWL